MAIQEQIYNELGENFRVSLRWREKLFGGFFIILGSLALAFFKTVGHSEYSHAAVIRKFGELVAVGKYPPTFHFLAVGAKPVRCALEDA